MSDDIGTPSTCEILNPEHIGPRRQYIGNDSGLLGINHGIT